MNLFEAVKQSVTPRQAAEYYGVKVNRNGMACCPFHQDKHPSMKIYKERFHCFGCQADGDVIDFTARLFGLSGREAAEKLAADFGVSYDRRGHSPKARPTDPLQSVRKKLSEKERFQQGEQKCFRVYSDYLHLLRLWRLEYAPKPDDEEWHPLFVEALEQQTYVEYLLDILLSGLLGERAALIIEKAKDVYTLEQRIAGYRAREPTCSEMSGFRHGKGKDVNRYER